MPQRRLTSEATKAVQRASEDAPLHKPFPPSVQALMPQEVDTPPIPDHPSSFKPEPFVNDPDIQNLLHQFLKAAPGLGDRLGRVQVGDDGASNNRVQDSPMKGHPMADTTLLGTTDLNNNNNISLNPSLLTFYKDHLPTTLLHEILHTLGAGEQQAYATADKLGDLNVFEKGKK